MAIIAKNGSITITKYNNESKIDISIRDSDNDEVLILHDDVVFLHKMLNEWLEEIKDA